MSAKRSAPLRGPDDPWFRIGRLDVTTTVAVVATVLVGWLVWVIQPSIVNALYLSTTDLLRGQVWRLVSWPLAEGLSLWSAISLFFFWYFGSELERATGRVQMGGLLIGIWASLTVPAVLLSLLLRVDLPLGGMNLPQFIVLLLWIAEYPTRRFFFNIPAWVLGLVLLGIQVLTLLAARGWGSLLVLLFGLVGTALIARQVGLLTEASWLPRFRRKPRAAQPSRERVRRQGDRERLDALLDKINTVGIGGLTAGEKRELHALRDRLRGQR